MLSRLDLWPMAHDLRHLRVERLLVFVAAKLAGEFL
jgi:hypothetical protein